MVSEDGDTKLNEVILCKLELRIENLKLNLPSTSKSSFPVVSRKITVQYKLGDFPEFNDEVTLTPKGPQYSLGKTIVFPHHRSSWKALQLFIIDKEIAVAFCNISCGQLLTPLPNQDCSCTACGFRLLDASGKPMGHIELYCRATMMDTLLTESLKRSLEVQPIVTRKSVDCPPKDHRDVLVFRTNEKHPKMLVELKAPRGRPQRQLPPYHEDVSVQTEDFGRKKPVLRKKPKRK